MYISDYKQKLFLYVLEVKEYVFLKRYGLIIIEFMWLSTAHVFVNHLYESDGIKKKKKVHVENLYNTLIIEHPVYSHFFMLTLLCYVVGELLFKIFFSKIKLFLSIKNKDWIRYCFFIVKSSQKFDISPLIVFSYFFNMIKNYMDFPENE